MIVEFLGIGFEDIPVVGNLPAWILVLVLIAIQVTLAYLAYVGVRDGDAFERLAIQYDKSSFSRSIIALGPVGQAIDGILTNRAETTGDNNGAVCDAIAAFWEVNPDTNIDIVCSEIPDNSKPDFARPTHRNYLRYVKFADLDSLIYIRYHLASLNPSPKIRTFTDSEYHDVNTDTMVLVGGPAWNENAAELQTQLPCHFERNPLGKDDPIIFDLPELEYYRFGPEWDEHDNLVSDIAIFSKITLEDKQTIFYVAGCLTWGVKGAAKCFLDAEVVYDNFAFLQDELDKANFTLICEVKRYGRRVESPRLSENVPLVLVTDEENEFEVKTWNIEPYRTT